MRARTKYSIARALMITKLSTTLPLVRHNDITRDRMINPLYEFTHSLHAEIARNRENAPLNEARRFPRAIPRQGGAR